MAQEIQVATFEQITTMLSQLMTNYSSISSKYYDIFYNSNPLDVQIQLYNSEGVLTTYTIPNRAKDFRYVRNGSGSPEGVVVAPIGTIYQDTTNGVLYIKELGDESTGWIKINSGDEIERGSGNPEGVLIREKGALYIDVLSASLYIKATDNGNDGWVLISASTTNLASRALDNLTSDGEAHFANPSLSNLNTTGQAVVNAKEDVVNKVISISSTSTDTQYPSAKATYSYIDTAISGKENTSNKVTSISSTSTDTQYPSARATYSHVNTAIAPLAKTDFSNVVGLTATIPELNYCDGVTSNIQTQLNGKASINLDNISSTGKSAITSWGMPDYSAGVSFNSGATVPVDAVGYANLSGGSPTVDVNGINVLGQVSQDSYRQWIRATFLIPKGSTVTYSGCSDVKYFPMKGAN